jgi:Helix-turn-helix domain of resolvase
MSLAGTEPGRTGVISVEDWAEIRRLHRAEGMPIKAIVRVLGVSRNTVRAALASDGPPRYQRKPAGSIVDAVEPRIRELLQACPTMPATVIAERDRLDSLDPRAVWTGGGVAAGLSAAGSGESHQLRAGRDRAVRLVVSTDRAAGRVRPGAAADAAAIWLEPYRWWPRCCVPRPATR